MPLTQERFLQQVAKQPGLINPLGLGQELRHGIGTAKFSASPYSGGETVELALEAAFAPKPVPEGDLPF